MNMIIQGDMAEFSMKQIDSESRQKSLRTLEVLSIAQALSRSFKAGRERHGMLEIVSINAI